MKGVRQSGQRGLVFGRILVFDKRQGGYENGVLAREMVVKRTFDDFGGVVADEMLGLKVIEELHLGLDRRQQLGLQNLLRRLRRCLGGRLLQGDVDLPQGVKGLGCANFLKCWL